MGWKDPLQYSNGMEFSTPDEDNDSKTSGNCAANYGGGWWHFNCFYFCGTCSRGLALKEKHNIWHDGKAELPRFVIMWMERVE